MESSSRYITKYVKNREISKKWLKNKKIYIII